MNRRCCVAGPAWRRPARRLSRVTASMLPGAVLVLLPKCPLCLAAWLTTATGVSVSAAASVWVRAAVVMLWVAALTPLIARRVFGGAPAGSVARI